MEPPLQDDALMEDGVAAGRLNLPLDVAVVSAGEEEEGHIYDEHDDEDEDEGDIFSDDDGLQGRTQQEQDADELLYDVNMDADDEAYVYQYLRGGGGNGVLSERHGSSVASGLRPKHQLEPSGADADTTSARNNDARLPLKPQLKQQKKRQSDAVLSCPACFNIVCMDCQRHERYPDQFRAMFVMGIVVDWHSLLMYDENSQHLVPKPHVAPSALAAEWPNPGISDARQVPIVDDDGHQHVNGNGGQRTQHVKGGDDEEMYYSVHCNSCGMQVAALDMKDEVYHFFGCLASG